MSPTIPRGRHRSRGYIASFWCKWVIAVSLVSIVATWLSGVAKPAAAEAKK
jgi:hypothetical protein